MFSSVQWKGKRTVVIEFSRKEIQKCGNADNKGLYHLYLFWFILDDMQYYRTEMVLGQVSVCVWERESVLYYEEHPSLKNMYGFL